MENDGGDEPHKSNSLEQGTIEVSDISRKRGSRTYIAPDVGDEDFRFSEISSEPLEHHLLSITNLSIDDVLSTIERSDLMDCIFEITKQNNLLSCNLRSVTIKSLITSVELLNQKRQNENSIKLEHDLDLLALSRETQFQKLFKSNLLTSLEDLLDESLLSDFASEVGPSTAILTVCGLHSFDLPNHPRADLLDKEITLAHQELTLSDKIRKADYFEQLMFSSVQGDYFEESWTKRNNHTDNIEKEQWQDKKLNSLLNNFRSISTDLRKFQRYSIVIEDLVNEDLREYGLDGYFSDLNEKEILISELLFFSALTAGNNTNGSHWKMSLRNPADAFDIIMRWYHTKSLKILIEDIHELAMLSDSKKAPISAKKLIEQLFMRRYSGLSWNRMAQITNSNKPALILGKFNTKNKTNKSQLDKIKDVIRREKPLYSEHKRNNHPFAILS